MTVRLQPPGAPARDDEQAPAQPGALAAGQADAQHLAQAVARRMLTDDAAARAMGITVEAVGPGTATLAMRVREDMLNGFAICHGGFITTLADTAFAYACNSRNLLTVASGLAVDFVSPARAGEQLVACAQEVSLAGRTGVYDVRVTAEGSRLVAVMRGRSHRTSRFVIPPGDEPGGLPAAPPQEQ